mmetsp:Transcript_20836/g.23802  ORF Transcript_20836/g.23802 Transcript_20836/m.23802 type:complete len:708 (+) Transcript_20836:168-2291(+)|eukprot:CAMPEP_0194149418 /NCGR_PEP_ID=MMETSP0152-20130528/37676_1 /TAXON_ID=1049557 /ORGANISM="Thalassiothrix antarctica, Strain L6-D1" /LENGTH=707 /DNA_ID=CAMNT_0038851561 /DNA_START=125 /DNA_END=2248 /DNA_ORIENTATION=+
MPVDEFGREIPVYGGGKRPPSPRYDAGIEESRSYRSRRVPSESPPRRRPRPIERYVQEPMLCEFVWKDQVQRDHNDKIKDVDSGETGKLDLEQKHGSGKDTGVESKESYDEYRKRYCLNYVRAFFNEHMDDSWFRNRYSPLGRKRIVMQHLERALSESHVIRQELERDDEEFIRCARLGSGVKERSSGLKRKHDDNSIDMNVPTSHILSICNRLVRLMDIPPHVTENQLITALLDHSSNPNIRIQVFSGSVRAQDKTNPLHRDAFCIFESVEVRQDILVNIQKASASASAESEGHVPRKDDRKVLEFDVECSDPYGRLEVEDEAGGTVQHRKASIFLSIATITQKVVVLSAAVSSKDRILKDKEAAFLIARALDLRHQIPIDSRLDNLAETLSSYSNEDILDVAIAYLRRVHLFSFYNGCVRCDNLADVLSGNHFTSTIHLRLKDADDILHKAKEEISEAHREILKGDGEEDNSKTTDLLVMRLDESIRKASEATQDWITNDGFVNKAIDAEAVEIEGLEKKTEVDWINHHGVVDGDGRARCSFHFCRKLFKDMNFLEKHLRKKHSEFLKAEIAKCHDSYMMRAWDREEIRPVPSILADCGSNFGLVPSQVLGSVTPNAIDPEPELWKKEEDRRKRLSEQEVQRHQHRNRYNNDNSSHNDIPQPPVRRNNFVDVDDMKEEKVEMSFENVEVPVQPPKKKKKKKKKLL